MPARENIITEEQKHELKALVAKWFGIVSTVLFGLALMIVMVQDLTDMFGRYPALILATTVGILLVALADYYRS